MHSVYRHANNQKIDQYIQKNRTRQNAYFYKKGSDSAKNMIKALKNNEDLALLVDQRDSSGPIINFFGKQAYATDGFANLALKYQTIICPVYSIRKKNGNFKFIYEKPLYFKDYKDLSAYNLVEKITLTISKNGLKKIPLNGYGSIKDGDCNFYFLIKISPSCILTENSSTPFNVFKSLIKFCLYFKME